VILMVEKCSIEGCDEDATSHNTEGRELKGEVVLVNVPYCDKHIQEKLMRFFGFEEED